MHGANQINIGVSAPAAPERPSLRVMVVDGCADGAECLALMLRFYGHVVHVSHDGASVLAQLPAFRPDVVLMDITLPDLPGQEVVRRIRQDDAWRDLPVLVITGWSLNELEENALAAGFNLYRLKPVDIDFLSNLPEIIAGCAVG